MSGARTVEAVVVGAGPGGSVAAAHLARAGRQVLLLEAQKLPRSKVCGDVLLPEVDELLREIGSGFDAIAADGLRLDGCRYASAGGRAAAGRFVDSAGRPRPSRVLPRRLFDARLAAHAAGCGAELAEEHRLLAVEWDAAAGRNRLTVATAGGPRRFVTPLLIGADGAASRVARDRGLRRRGGEPGLCVGLRGYVDWRRDDRRLTVLGDRDLLPGCGWIVPQPGGRANVGVGMIEADRRARGIGLDARLRRLLATHAASAGPVRGLAGWQLPTGGLGSRRPAADGVLLVGDAAGLVDPFTGHGIHNAMLSGALAGGLALRALRRADASLRGPIGAYEGRLRAALGFELRLGRLLQRLHARPALVGLAVARAAASARWADRFLGLVGHAAPRRHLLGPGFLLDFVRPPG